MITVAALLSGVVLFVDASKCLLCQPKAVQDKAVAEWKAKQAKRSKEGKK